MVTEEWQYSGLKYENCLHNIGSGWTGVCRLCTEMVVDWGMQTIYKRVVVVVEWIGLEYTDSLQKTGSGSGLEYTDCLQKSGINSGVENAECLQKSGRSSGLEYSRY